MMDETNIIGIWKGYDSQFEKLLKIEKQQLEDISKIKVFHHLSSMKPIKYFALLVGLIWVIGGLYLLKNLYLHGFEGVSKFFFFSFAAQLFITAVALLIYVVQLVHLYTLDITEPIYSTQKKLTKLRKSTLWVTRILFLQLPFWASFQISETMLRNGNLLYLLVNGLVILLFTLISAWLFINIRYENRDKKWFRLIFSGIEWTPIIKSEDLLRQLEDENETSL
jgi:hypothetical protein